MIHLAGYEYLEPLGGKHPGSFGQVFRARNLLSGQIVAIKHIDAPLTAASMAAWETEAKAMAACEHDNLVRIHHAEITPDGPALVMEFIPGGSLANRYRDKSAPVGDVVDIVADACWGLQRLHQEGFTHRDIKPANLLLGDRGVKIGDFGLVGGPHDPPDLVYAAHEPPEVSAGGLWTPAGDIYTLGVTAWRLLWGDKAAGRDAPDFADRLKRGQFPDREEWPPHVHRGLRTTLRAALHPDNSKRPASAADFRARTERVRPAVSWVTDDFHSWTGRGAKSRWEVRVDSSSIGHDVVTTRTSVAENGRWVRFAKET